MICVLAFRRGIVGELEALRRRKPLSAQAGDGIFVRDLDRNAANYAPLSPLSFLALRRQVYPAKTAVIHGDARYTYARVRARVPAPRLGARARGVGRGDTVAVMAPNVPALLEAHYAVPGSARS